MLFLLAILAVVASDRHPRRRDRNPDAVSPVTAAPAQEAMLGCFAALAVATAALLTWRRPVSRTVLRRRWKRRGPAAPAIPDHHRPGRSLPRFPPPTSTGSAPLSVTPDEGSGERQAGAKTDPGLGRAWDDAQDQLQPMDGTAWTYLDGKIDQALQAVQARHPGPRGPEAGARRAAETLR